MPDNLVLEELERRILNDMAATYFVGKYYFLVNTNKNRREEGLMPGEEMTLSTQRKLQGIHFTSLFHEYVHYIHEISTVVGSIGLSLDLVLKTVFSHYFSTDLSKSDYNGLDVKNPAIVDLYSKVYTTKETLNGGGPLETILVRVDSYTFKAREVYLPLGTNVAAISLEIPCLKLILSVDNTYKPILVDFGKFYIYEGLAYELDRIVDRQIRGLAAIDDNCRGTEYVVLRSLARFIYPEIDTGAFLVAASLSLSYLDSGQIFISFIQRIKKGVDSGIIGEDVLQELRNETGRLLNLKINDFNEAQLEITEIFRKRHQLYTAFLTITEQAKAGYLLRCNSPSFEVDTILNGDYLLLPGMLPVCDYMYVFNDADEYMRDFLGSASFNNEESQALKILIAYDHYQKSHSIQPTIEIEKKESFKCPFYTCCNLQYRRDYENICANRPWRIFEISYNGDKQFCWYGQAVLEFKGPNEL